ncbi:serine-rich adhesin for platelets-like [Haliotis asinina]|uniref:serine-rich adhesin for platelets-like n=1 Tax=Haliotis asinina TaxID=109174 RepID=UPI003531D152
MEPRQEYVNTITTEALVSSGKGEKYLWTKRATRIRPEYLSYTGGTANESHLASTPLRTHTFLLERRRLLVVAIVVVVIVVVAGAVVGGVLVSNKTEPQASSTATRRDPDTSSKSNLLTDLTPRAQPLSTSYISTDPSTSSTRTRTSPLASSPSTTSTASSTSAVSSSPQSTISPLTSTISQKTSQVSSTSSTSASSSSLTAVSTASSTSAVASSPQSTISPLTSTISPKTSQVSSTSSTSASSSSLTAVSTTSSTSAVSSSPQSTSTTSQTTSPVSSASSASTPTSQSSTTATPSTTRITTSAVTTTTTSLPYLTMSDITFNEGEDDLYLLCTVSVDSKIIEVLFFKDGIELKDDVIIGVNGRECSLTKKGATCSDSGEYVCQVSGEFGTIKTTSTVKILVEPKKPSLKITKEKLIGDAWQATLSCERRLGQPATVLHWRVLFNTGEIMENIFSAQSNIKTKEGCSSSVISEVTELFKRSWDGAEICCYLTDAGGMTLNLEGCDIFTYTTDVSPCDCTTDSVAVPRPTTYPDNCNLYYTCKGGVKQDATCTGGDIFSADPNKQACTANEEESYCAKVKASEVKVCTATSK